MRNETGEAYVMNYFDDASIGLTKTIGGLVDDPQSVVRESRAVLREEIMNKLPYLDAPGSFLGNAVFFSACYLAVWLTLKKKGVDVHKYGRAILSNPESFPLLFDEKNTENWWESPGTHPGEFTVEFVELEEGFTGNNMTSCGECKLYKQFDAMELMPYMCATDDFNEAFPPGLRREGTLALGHSHCDFRYREGDTPTKLAEQFPEKIRWIES